MSAADPSAPAAPRVPVVVHVLAGALVLFGLLFFFQTKDPMILLMALLATGALYVVLLVLRLLAGGAGGPGGAAPQVRVRCRDCRALNLEDARYCGQCGRPL